jgi:hypothetical protein
MYSLIIHNNSTAVTQDSRKTLYLSIERLLQNPVSLSQHTSVPVQEQTYLSIYASCFGSNHNSFLAVTACPLFLAPYKTQLLVFNLN